jgi:hypothetical protein
VRRRQPRHRTGRACQDLGPASWTTAARAGRAVEQLRLVTAEVQVATVRIQVMFSLITDFENFSVFKPQPSSRESGQRHARPAHRLGRRDENPAKQRGVRGALATGDGRTVVALVAVLSGGAFCW